MMLDFQNPSLTFISVYITSRFARISLFQTLSFNLKCQPISLLWMYISQITMNIDRDVNKIVQFKLYEQMLSSNTSQASTGDKWW